jgi:hypothetical protein
MYSLDKNITLNFEKVGWLYASIKKGGHLALP